MCVLGLLACKEGLQEPAKADPGVMRAGEVLVVGRIHVLVFGDDRTGGTLFLTNAREGEMMIPDDGLVTWLLGPSHGPPRILYFTGPALSRTGRTGATVPYFVSYLPVGVDRPPVPIVYFGTITLRLEEGDVRTQVGVPGKSGIGRKDEADDTFRELVRINPRFAGVRYYHAMRGTVLQAP